MNKIRTAVILRARDALEKNRSFLGALGHLSVPREGWDGHLYIGVCLYRFLRNLPFRAFGE